jgi:hypothetical protein
VTERVKMGVTGIENDRERDKKSDRKRVTESVKKEVT